MTSIHDLQLRDLVSNAFTNVFSTMLKMKVELRPEGTAANIPGERVVGSVGFAGKAIGVVYIHVSDGFAQAIASAMLGMTPGELGTHEVDDVLGEVSNMVGGNLKSSLCDAGLPCALTIPSITRGGDFHIQSMAGGRHENFAFRHESHEIFVRVDVKPGD
jgi:CheY-specific phosphatase CheX